MQAQFEDFRQAYPGLKRDSDTEFGYFICRHRDKWQDILPKLKIAIDAQIAYKDRMDRQGKWTPDWPFLKKWIDESRWTLEIPEEKKEKKYFCNGCGQEVPRGTGYVEGQAIYCTSKCKYAR